MPQSVRVDVLGDSGAPGGGLAGVPDGLIRHRFAAMAILKAWKDPTVLVLQRAVVGPKLIVELRAEGNLAVLAALALADVDHHPFLVDVLGPQMAQLGAAHAGGIQSHQDGAVAEVGGGGDQPRHFPGAEDGGHLPAEQFGEGQVIARIAPLQDLQEQEAQGCHLDHDRLRVQLALNQVELILPHVLKPQ